MKDTTQTPISLNINHIIAIALIGAFGWMFNQNATIALHDREIGYFRKFVEVPRFTQSDFNSQIKPYNTRIESIQAEQLSRGSRIRELEDNYSNLSFKINRVSDDVADIKNILKQIYPHTPMAHQPEPAYTPEHISL